MPDPVFPEKGTPAWEELVENLAREYNYRQLTRLLDGEEAESVIEVYVAAIASRVESERMRRDLGLQGL